MIGRPAVSFADGLLNAGNGGTFYAILVIMAFLSFFICDAFCDLYAVGIDTVLLCFLEDKRYNDGSMMKPYKANPTLKKFMHKYAAGSGQGSVKHPGTGHAIPAKDALSVPAPDAVAAGPVHGSLDYKGHEVKVARESHI